MSIPLFLVDAFTSEKFAGNPAAVCLLEWAMPDDWMQSVATEMNLSDTAFAVKRPDGYDLRWFTPAMEVMLCGHATLATAYVLYETGALADDDVVHFNSRSGTLTARRRAEMIELDFPLKPAEAIAVAPALTDALRARIGYCGRTVSDGGREMNYIVELEDERTVRELVPDFQALRSLPGAVIATARADEGASYDFVSRFFAGSHGVDEDPVTGSAHCTLLPFWSERIGRTDLMGYQASKRGGYVQCRIADGRAKLGGSAVMVARGELMA